MEEVFDAGPLLPAVIRGVVATLIVGVGALVYALVAGWPAVEVVRLVVAPLGWIVGVEIVSGGALVVTGLLARIHSPAVFVPGLLVLVLACLHVAVFSSAFGLLVWFFLILPLGCIIAVSCWLLGWWQWRRARDASAGA